MRDQRREEQKRENEARKAAKSSGGNFYAPAVILEDYAQKERDLNEDHRNNLPPGTTARQREEARAAMRKQDEDIKRTIKEQHVSWDLAWWMVNEGMTIEEATKREEKYREDSASSSGRSKEYVDFDERRRSHDSYRRGRDTGDTIGIDEQVSNKSTRRIS